MGQINLGDIKQETLNPIAVPSQVWGGLSVRAASGMGYCCVLGPVLKPAEAPRIIPEACSEHKRPKKADFEFWWMLGALSGPG